MKMNADGSRLQKMEGVNATPVKYSTKAGKLAYIKSEDENQLVFYDLKNKSQTVVLDGAKLNYLFD
jgi:hypothetical protein